MPRDDRVPCPSCGHRPAVLFSSAEGWVVMCLRWDCQAAPRTPKHGKNRGDVVKAWNDEHAGCDNSEDTNHLRELSDAKNERKPGDDTREEDVGQSDA